MRRTAITAAVLGVLIIGLGACGPGPDTKASHATGVSDTRSTAGRATGATARARSATQQPLTATPGGVDIPVGAVQHVITAPSNDAPVSSAQVPVARPAPEAVRRFLDAVRTADGPVAYGLLTDADRRSFGSAAAFSGFLANEPAMTGFHLSPSSTGVTAAEDGPRRVNAQLTFAPAVDSIVGVVAPTASATVDAVAEHGLWKVAWTKRVVRPTYAPDSRVVDDITSWAESRRSCHGATNESPELTGVVGLASALCGTKTAVSVDPSVSTFDNLDDPQPVLDTFGETAPVWARVVTITGPVPMRVVAAPLGDHWIAVAVDRFAPS